MSNHPPAKAHPRPMNNVNARPAGMQSRLPARRDPLAHWHKGALHKSYLVDGGDWQSLSLLSLQCFRTLANSFRGVSGGGE